LKETLSAIVLCACVGNEKSHSIHTWNHWIQMTISRSLSPVIVLIRLRKVCLTCGRWPRLPRLLFLIHIRDSSVSFQESSASSLCPGHIAWQRISLVHSYYNDKPNTSTTTP
jgi:hypothetical protein